jgi:hypothetical protein
MNLGRLHGLLVGVCCAALLLAGTTWSLWREIDTRDGGQVLLGTLDIETVASPVVMDISADRDDSDTGVPDAVNSELGPTATQTCFPTVGDVEIQQNLYNTKVVRGHLVDTSLGEAESWHATPVDEVAVVYPMAISLKGDNMVADLVATLTKPFAEFVTIPGNRADNYGNNIWMAMYVEGEKTFEGNLNTFGYTNQHPLTFATVQGENQDSGTLDSATLPGTGRIPVIPVVKTVPPPGQVANACLVVTFLFDDWGKITGYNLDSQRWAYSGTRGHWNRPPNEAERNRYKAVLDLPQNAFTLKLTQTRDSGVGHFQ